MSWARVCLASLLALAAPAFAQDAPAEEEAAAEEEIPEVSDEDRAAAFEEYDNAMQSGQKNRAADALLPILQDPQLQAIHGEAWVKLADLLAGFDMEYAALVAYSKGIAADPVTAASQVDEAIALADKMGDDAVLAPAVAQNVGIDVDTATRSRMAYLAARYNFRNGQMGTAQGLLMLVDKKSKIYAEAEALRGVLLSQQGRHEDALAPLLTAQALGPGQGKDQRFIDVTNLNLARAYFGADNFPRAIEYYAKVTRGSQFWPEAMYERAWAHFRLQDMKGTLGILHTHQSPFFDEWYFPEASLLRVYSLFLMCKFPDATTVIEDFTGHYTPVLELLDRELATMSPQAAWDDTKAFVQTEGHTPRLPEMMVRRYTVEDRFLGKIAAVDKADEEITRLASATSNPFAALARDLVEERKAQLIAEEGQRIIDNANGAKAELKGMLSNVQVTKLDMMRFETRLYEQAAATGKAPEGPRAASGRKDRKERQTREWPYEAEYWADELGYYRVTANPDCPASLTPGS